VRIVSQPFWLWWTTVEGKRRGHAPDFLVLLDDGTADGAVLVLDSRPLELIAETDRAAFEATDRACVLLNWRYAVWDRMDGVANQKWLAAHRHPRCYNDPVAARLAEVFAQPRPLMEGAELAGDPLGTLPVLYHLLWTRRLLADLALVLSDRTIVRTAPTADRAYELVPVTQGDRNG